MPRRYPAEVRRQVIELARSGTKVAQLAETFGMSDATIYTWLKQERAILQPRMETCSQIPTPRSAVGLPRSGAAGMTPRCGQVRIGRRIRVSRIRDFAFASRDS